MFTRAFQQLLWGILQESILVSQLTWSPSSLLQLQNCYGKRLGFWIHTPNCPNMRSSKSNMGERLFKTQIHKTGLNREETPPTECGGLESRFVAGKFQIAHDKWFMTAPRIIRGTRGEEKVCVEKIKWKKLKSRYTSTLKSEGFLSGEHQTEGLCIESSSTAESKNNKSKPRRWQLPWWSSG